ncbi:hypothetical protein SEA_SPEEDDEMON_220 [Gordonia phage SpeedDemon]|uniref:Uncharacterized protein n=1 Tax=Gordonia phage Bantam TaxID=1887641 RepID=A0A1B3AY94_9CAUD|nr:neck protein [Gordonia phage Bantam]AOE43711.1 hypothetical protein SEA_BANTAM_21 [Gordonia phage Bantam]QNL30473.1 hypothetical protein SEA_SPEEDDEMON_220 [Gordonia phage SpeedDemon]
MARLGDGVRFSMKRDYASKALKSPDMQQMIMKKGRLAVALYRSRVKKRSGENARKIRSTITIGGDKLDRVEAHVTAYAPHALAREFGAIRKRGGEYTDEVAKRYGRDVLGRATSRGAREAVLGGDNRKRLSVVKTLEEK